MKKLFLLIVLGLTCFAAFGAAPKVQAIEVFAPCTNTAAATGTVCKDVQSQKSASTNPVNQLLKVVLDILSFIAGIAAIILIIINSLRLIASGGDANGIKTARSGLIYALVGVAIVVSAQSIIIFVLDKIS